MEEFLIDLEQLKVKPGDDVIADRIDKIVDAIIENRKSIIKHYEDHKSDAFSQLTRNT